MNNMSMTIEKKLVSVILATHNGAAYIKQSIDSVLSQSYDQFELLIINDASTDTTENIVSAIRDTRIRYVANKNRLGLTKSLNKGISLTHGEYAARIDDDDVWCNKDKLALQVLFLKENPAVGLVGTSAEVVSSDMKKMYTLQYPLRDEALRREMLLRNQFIHSSVVMRRAVLEDIGDYDESVLYAQDYELWLRIGSKYKLANIMNICVQLRQRPHSVSSQKRLRQWISFVRSTFRYRKVYPSFYRYLSVYCREFMLNSVRGFRTLS